MMRLGLLAFVLVACGPSSIQGQDGDDTTDPVVTEPQSNPTTPPPAAPSICTTSPETQLGAWCEFDGECCSGQRCVSAQCAPPPGACVNNDGCSAGYLCIEGRCVDCLTDAECAEGATCEDGTCVASECPGGVPDIVGTWYFESQLDVGEAAGDIVLGVGDAAAELCDWIEVGSYFADLPAWAPDLICLVGDITTLMHDMDVGHRVRVSATADPVVWRAQDSWQWVILDPDGRNIAVDPAALACPVSVEAFDIVDSCGVLYFERHDVELSVNGLVRLALDSMACASMDGAWGCSWDAALDEICAGFGDPMLAATCSDLISALVIPDPCVDTTGMTLAGTAAMTGAGRMAGDWAGTISLGDFAGIFTATRL